MTIKNLIRAKQQPDTLAQVRWRGIARRAAELGVADRIEKFPELTAENAQAAIDYQNERVKAHEARLVRQTVEDLPVWCSNCGQWQHPPHADCVNECRQRGFVSGDAQ